MMFQDFEDSPGSAGSAERVAALRMLLEKRKLAGFLVPRSDEHIGEYVPPSAERLRWISGFTGSAGIAAILASRAALFVDGRYTLQARNQADTDVFEVLQTPDSKLADWLKATLKKGDRLGYDPKLHTVNGVRQLEKAVARAGASLATQPDSPLDAVWHDRPDAPVSPAVPHPPEFAGESSSDKIERLQSELKDAKAAAAILTMPDSIAWLFNIRGADLPHTPVPLAFAVLHAGKAPELFIDARKLSDTVKGYLEQNAVIREPGALEDRLNALGKSGATVRLDPDSASAWFADTLKAAGAEIQHGSDPCLLPKAIKNETEIGGSRAAHKRDGVALARFLAWLDREAPSGKLDEISAAEKLESLRAGTGELKEISFDTISGAGANGAIVHYRVTLSSNAKLKPGSLYLVDSGAQYADGTTDVTRTIAIGEPTPHMRRHFTLVLKGHIGIATARFPKGARGADLDPFARRALWEAGLDFDHGTGHGVGSYLSVHEGPARISRLGTAVLEPGMILSNEPGYYKEGEYGIRIENLVLVTGLEGVPGGEREMMDFETLTLAPIDRRLIVPAMLTIEERAWLETYHRRVREEIGPLLEGEDRAWLEKATAPLEDA